MKVLNVLIVGAGIGGLTHALCLSLAGHRVTILEANPSAEFLGAGIQISPNATKVLQSIGLGPALAFKSRRTRLKYCNRLVLGRRLRARRPCQSTPPFVIGALARASTKRGWGQ